MGNAETKDEPKTAPETQTVNMPETSPIPQTTAAPKDRTVLNKKTDPANKTGLRNIVKPQKRAASRSRAECATNQNVQVQLPQPFNTEAEFLSVWVRWKELFIKCILKFDEQNAKQQERKYMLLNRMGSVALDICEKTKTSVENETFYSLLHIFDAYHMLQNKKRQPGESPHVYVKNLQGLTSMKSPEIAISLTRSKLKKEIKVTEFTHAAYSVLPEFKFDSDFDHLTLAEIAYIWQLSDNFELGKTHKIVDCNSCGLNHKSKCPAKELQCSLCKGFNHLSARCPRIYLFHCEYCGGKHRMRECPAYGELCRRCNRQNHFPWKCDSQKFISCRFCSTSHPRSRAACPARNNLCDKCNTTGHYSFKCNAVGNS